MAKNEQSTWEKLSRVLVMPPLEPSRQLDRILSIERDIILPVRLALIAYLVFGLFYSEWFWDQTIPRELIQISLRWYFVVYTILSIVAARFLLTPMATPLNRLRKLVFGVATLDIVLVAGLTAITDGFTSTLFWMFIALVVRNALSMPAMGPQLTLQLITNFAFVLAGSLDVWVDVVDVDLGDPDLSYAARRALEE
ncbi:MAG TPA: hypothetical protein DCY13_23905, partial [Verrucomicrobiales bacterium]|nr:hypothetical protein [Verrucomicrobiales bacterium]